MWAVARRPKWIAALIGALAVAAVFAALGQWQWERSFANVNVPTRDTENPVALTDVATPQSTITTDASGRMVLAECDVVADDDLWVSDRVLPQGRGDWLIRHCRTPEGHSLALAVGWLSADDPQERSLSLPVPTGREYVGRYVPTESPQSSDFDRGERSAISVAELINLWGNPGPVYGGYLVTSDAPAGLSVISTEPPPPDGELNWLNLFYAAEWAIFALFALYLWYRLVRDEWEKHQMADASTAQA